MSAVVEPESDVVWHGVDVSVAEVVRALSEIRRQFALKELGPSEHPYPRSSVMTLIAVAANDEEERHAERACRLIGTQHPAQMIVIREHTADIKGVQIEAWISTEVVRPQSARPFMNEIVTLHVRGILGEHLAALVDPMLVSGVPTNLWWIGTPPFEKHEFADALRICDALVVDSAHFANPHRSFLGLSNLLATAHKRLGVGDLQWSRLRPWRESIAGFFAPMDRRDYMKGINEVGIDYAGEGRGNRIGASLLIGWFTSALGWKLQKAAAGGGGIVAARYLVDGWRPVDVQFRSKPKDHLAQGEICAVRISGSAMSNTYRLTVERDPERRAHPFLDGSVKELIRPGGEDDAGAELSKRRAEWHRKNHGELGQMESPDPAEDRPKRPMVFTRERRRPDSEQVLLTMIQIGEGRPLRHVQRIDSEEEFALLLDVLASGTHDPVFVRSLMAAAELVQAF
jgi:glucose-6-phosphate dehydrogenase assembly protein OpcA